MKKALRSIIDIRPSEIGSLNGLRAFCIFVLLFYHLWEASPFREVLGQGSPLLSAAFRNLTAFMDLFFMLSGFLIYGGLKRLWEKTGKVNIKEFLVNRVLRIMPAYYVFMLIVTAALFKRWYDMQGMPLGPAEQLASDTLQRLLLSSYADFLYISDYVKGSQLHTWALSVEWKFYLFFPVFAYFFLFRVPNKWRLVILGAAYVAPLLLRLIAYSVSDSARFIEYSYFEEIFYKPAHMRFDSIVAGAIVYEVSAQMKFVPGRGLAILFFLAGGAMLGSFFGLWYADVPLWYSVFRFNASQLAFALIFFSALQADFIVSKFLSAGFFRAISRISYGMYLWHLFAFQYATKAYFKNTPGLTWGKFGLAFAQGFLLTLVLALLSYLFIEWPFLTKKEHFKSRPES